MNKTDQSAAKRNPVTKWLIVLAMLGLLVVSGLIIRNASRGVIIEQNGKPVQARIVSTDCEGGWWKVSFEGKEYDIEAGSAADRCQRLTTDSVVTLFKVPGDAELRIPGVNHKGRWLYGALIGIVGVFGLLVIVFRGGRKATKED